eukprot:m.167595 g.167595  ORF g.167595 m.167595 type:complete len:164 (-) comp12846_c0_seq1:109-600(-)
MRTEGYTSARRSVVSPTVKTATTSPFNPWTIGRIMECTQSKIERMEQREPELRRYLLVHKVLQSVHADVDVVSVPATQQADPEPMRSDPTTQDCTPLMTEASPTSPPPRKRRASHTLRRRRRLAPSSEKLSSRPFKKRRMKRLLGDAGTFAATSNSIVPSCGA